MTQQITLVGIYPKEMTQTTQTLLWMFATTLLQREKILWSLIELFRYIIALQVLVHTVTQENKIRSLKIGKEEVK